METMTDRVSTLRRVNEQEPCDPATHGTLHCLDATGDTKLIWDRNNADEVAEARRTFDNLRRKGHAAWSVAKSGSKEKQITEFDAAAESLILVPQIQGGR